MHQGSVRWIAVAIVALAAGYAAPTVGLAVGHVPARHKPRPDLAVNGGSIRLARGTLSGSFTVRDSGATADASVAALVVTVGGRRRSLGAFDVPSLRNGRSFKVKVSKQLAALPAGRYLVVACADHPSRLKERSEANNCRRVGTLVVAGAGAPSQQPANPAPTTTTTTTTAPTTMGPAPLSAPDTTFQADTVFKQDNYWIYVPGTYDRTHKTPIELFVWLHGCGGESAGDIYTVADYWPDEDYIAIAPDGAEDGCWPLAGTGPKIVLDAIANVESHFNIMPRKIVIGGYSSGGDLAYLTAFYHADTFAGLIVTNTSPFRDTGSTAAQSLAAAAWKFHIVHLAHNQDDTYPLAGVTDEINEVKAAGFPVTFLSKDGHHYDDGPNGTDADIQNILIPYLNNDWLAPAQ